VRLLWVEVRGFRNHRETRLDVPDGVVAIVGDNAQGKTNLLEAIRYLLALSSPRVGSDEPLVLRGEDRAHLRGELQTMAGRVLVEVEVRASGANRVQVNRSAVRRKRDLRHRVRSALFIPEDVAIVQGDPEERRRFLDEAVESLWPAEEEARRAYDRALRQRNRLLKEHEGPGAPDDLGAWDAELASHGAAVTSARRHAMERVAPAAGDAFEEVAGERLRSSYRPSVVGEEDPGGSGGSLAESPDPSSDPRATPREDLEKAFLRRLEERRKDELVRRTTLVGPHRDELDLAVGELTARRFASHGEAWAGALCLRLGTAAAVAAEVEEPPVVLLDDAFSGLDPVRRRRLADVLRTRGQVLVTVPDEAHAPSDAAVWEVADGHVRPR